MGSQTRWSRVRPDTSTRLRAAPAAPSRTKAPAVELCTPSTTNAAPHTATPTSSGGASRRRPTSATVSAPPAIPPAPKAAFRNPTPERPMSRIWNASTTFSTSRAPSTTACAPTSPTRNRAGGSARSARRPASALPAASSAVPPERRPGRVAHRPHGGSARERDRGEGDEHPSGADGGDDEPGHHRPGHGPDPLAPVRDDVGRRQLVGRPGDAREQGRLRRPRDREGHTGHDRGRVHHRRRRTQQDDRAGDRRRGRLGDVAGDEHAARRAAVCQRGEDGRGDHARRELGGRHQGGHGRAAAVLGVHQDGDPLGVLRRVEADVAELDPAQRRVRERPPQHAQAWIRGDGCPVLSRAACSSSSVSSAGFTGVTSDQWPPTGQRWKRHRPSRTDFREPPGIQIVVNTCPARQRTTTFPASFPARSFTTAASTATKPTPRTRARRRRRGSRRRWRHFVTGPY